MRVVRPLTAECDDVLYSNVAVDFLVYDPHVTYAKGDKVAEANCGSLVYESLVNTNLGNTPSESPLEWLPVGSSNYYAMFDDKNATQTVNPLSIEVVVQFSELVNSVALVNLDATEARFEAWRADQDWTIDAPVYDVTVSLRDFGVSSWYEYYTYQVKQKENFVNFEMPTFVGGYGRMTLSKLTGDVKLGSLIYGSLFEIGDTEYGVTTGIKDYSTKEDDVFGNPTIVERIYKDTITARVVVEYARLLPVKQLLARNRARPLLWVGDEDLDVTITYGFYKQFNFNLESPAFARLDLTLEGI